MEIKDFSRENLPRPPTRQDDDEKKKEKIKIYLIALKLGNGSILQLERKWLLSIHMMIKKKKRKTWNLSNLSDRSLNSIFEAMPWGIGKQCVWGSKLDCV